MPELLAVPGEGPGKQQHNGLQAPKLERSKRAPTAKFLEMASVLEEFQHKPTRSATSILSEKTKNFCWKTRKQLRVVVQHRIFTGCIASIILLNAVYIGMETELVDDGSDLSMAWYLAELAFTFIFLVELFLRIAAARNTREFLGDSWNVFDSILVAISCIDTFVLSTLARNARKIGISTIRTIRLVRVARIFRLLRFFRELWVLVAGIIGAMATLLWTWILLALIIYVFGVFATRTIGQPSRDIFMDEYFGNVPRSMFTLFQVTTTEGWADIARKAMDEQVWTAGFFIIYFYVTTCAILNVVVAVIVENTLDQAGDQREKFNNKQKRVQKEACSKIYEVFYNLDDNGDGQLSKDEFLFALKQHEVTRYLHQIGLDMRQAENLFSILDFDESGSLDAQEFVGGVMKAIGPGRAKDVLALQCDLWRSEEKVWSSLQHAMHRSDAQMTAVEEGVKELRDDLRRLSRQLAEQRSAQQLEQLSSDRRASRPRGAANTVSSATSSTSCGATSCFTSSAAGVVAGRCTSGAATTTSSTSCVASSVACGIASGHVNKAVTARGGNGQDMTFIESAEMPANSE